MNPGLSFALLGNKNPPGRHICLPEGGIEDSVDGFHRPNRLPGSRFGFDGAMGGVPTVPGFVGLSVVVGFPPWNICRAPGFSDSSLKVALAGDGVWLNCWLEFPFCVATPPKAKGAAGEAIGVNSTQA